MTDNLKKISDQFVNSCTKVARNAVNQNACVQVEFTVWEDAKKLTEPQKISFAFPPPPPTTTLEQENEKLIKEIQNQQQKNAETEKELQILRQQFEFIRKEMMK